MKNDEINVLFNKFEIEKFEPTQIYYIHEYDFVVSLYSTLFENDSSGNIVGGLAQDYAWEKNKLKISLRTDHQSSKGEFITADDVIASIKRSMKLEDANHGSLKKYIAQMTTIDDFIEKIDAATILLRFEKRNDEVIKVLTNPEWSIFPMKSLKHDKWKVDYTNTSGPYYLSKADDNSFVLLANKKHYRYSDRLANKVNLIFIGYDESKVFDAIEKNKIDVLPIFYGINPVSILNRFSSNFDYKIHLTQGIQLHFIQFTKKGVSELSQGRRVSLGALFRKIYKEDTPPSPEIKTANAFFSVFGMSTISPDLENRVKGQYEQAVLEDESGAGLIIQARSEEVKKKYIEKFSKYLPNAKYHVPQNIKKDLTSNVIIGNIDSGFEDDLALLSYCASIGIFDGELESGGTWLDEYTRSDKEKRKAMFNDLHKKMLTTPSIIPLRTLPYAALTKKPWMINQTNLTASMPFWTIEHGQ